MAQALSKDRIQTLRPRPEEAAPLGRVSQDQGWRDRLISQQIDMIRTMETPF
jgi:hypothetical protein